MKTIKSLIKSSLKEKLGVPMLETCLMHLKKQGFAPNVVFDVGAYEGDFTKSIHHIWPESHCVCFEAQLNKVRDLNTLSLLNNKISVVAGLLGDINQESVTFYENATASSFLKEQVDSSGFTATQSKMRTLDSAIVEFNLPQPNLLKIDTQGSEYHILLGAQKTLIDIDVIIAETNLIDIHKGVRLANDVISLLSTHGFSLYDISELHRRPFDNALWQIDFVFVKTNSTFRANKTW